MGNVNCVACIAIEHAPRLVGDSYLIKLKSRISREWAKVIEKPFTLREPLSPSAAGGRGSLITQGSIFGVHLLFGRRESDLKVSQDVGYSFKTDC
jgi:hypothetical protein